MVKFPVDIPAVVVFFIAHFYHLPPFSSSLNFISSPLPVPPPLSRQLFSPVSCANLLFIKAKAHPGRVSSFVAGGYALYISWLVLLARRVREVGSEGWAAGKNVPPPSPFPPPPLCIKYPAITVITVTVLCEIARLPHRGRLRGLRPVAAYANAILLMGGGYHVDSVRRFRSESGARSPNLG